MGNDLATAGLSHAATAQCCVNLSQCKGHADSTRRTLLVGESENLGLRHGSSLHIGGRGTGEFANNAAGTIAEFGNAAIAGDNAERFASETAVNGFVDIEAIAVVHVHISCCPILMAWIKIRVKRKCVKFLTINMD